MLCEDIKSFDFLALVKDPKAVYPFLLEKYCDLLQKLNEVENKGWNNFLIPVSSVLQQYEVWGDSANFLYDASAISYESVTDVVEVLKNWDLDLLDRCGFIITSIIDCLSNLTDSEIEGNEIELNNIANLLNYFEKQKGLEVFFNSDGWKVFIKKQPFFANTKNLFLSQEIQEVRANIAEENYFVVDNLNILRSFAPKSLELAKKTAKKHNLEYRYALPLTQENVFLALRDCTNRNYRKYVYKRNFEVRNRKEWSNEEEIKSMLKNNIKEAKSLGYSSVKEMHLNLQGISTNDVQRFFDTAQSEIFFGYSKHMQELEKFAKEKFGIKVMRAWDYDFIFGQYLYHKKKELGVGTLYFSEQKILNKVKSLINKVFSIKMSEVKKSKYLFNRDDVIYKFERFGEVIGYVYISKYLKKGRDTTPFFVNLISDCFVGDSVPTLGLISLARKKGEALCLKGVQDLVHELGHAIQYMVATCNPNFKNIESKFRIDGMESLLIEFPSQWLEAFVKQADFLYGTVYNKRRYVSREEIEKYLEYNSIGHEAGMWENLFKYKADWLCYGSPSFLNNLNQKVIKLKKEFGLYTNKSDKAFTEFNHFQAKGLCFGYLLTENLVNLFNEMFKDKSLAEKGNAMLKMYYYGSEKGILPELSKVMDIFNFRKI